MSLDYLPSRRRISAMECRQGALRDLRMLKPSRVRAISSLLLAIVMLAFSVVAFAGDVKVRGYFRKDGTYVQPHYRTAPDSNPYNNYSFPGNYNPYTGEECGDPATYLENDYSKPNSLPGIEASVPTSEPSEWTAISNRSAGPYAVSALQVSLSLLGFNPGAIDGQLGPQTARALSAFQGARGLEVSGRLNRSTIVRANCCYSRTADGHGRNGHRLRSENCQPKFPFRSRRMRSSTGKAMAGSAVAASGRQPVAALPFRSRRMRSSTGKAMAGSAVAASGRQPVAALPFRSRRMRSSTGKATAGFAVAASGSKEVAA